MKKRILALATVVLMIFTVPLYSFAEDGTPAGWGTDTDGK